MFQVRRRGPVIYEDLLRELEVIENQLLSEESGLAMDLMVLEAKIRDRFHALEFNLQTKDILDEDVFDRDLSLEEARSLIPRDLPVFPSIADVELKPRKSRTWETVGMAAALAVITALGVFGLASILQVILNWLA